jgi:hypothetical protein
MDLGNLCRRYLMSFRIELTALGVAAALLTGCATTGFVSTWKAPDAQPLKPEGSKVAAVVMHKNEGSRRAAEDALARAITARGGEGIPSYSLLANATPDNEAQAKAAFEKAGVNAVVVMRPTGTRQEISSTTYASPYYGGYWGGGYYGYGWGGAYGGTEVRTDTIVSIETLVYSMKQNKLVWAGQSQTTNPTRVDALVTEIIEATVKEMQKQGLL